MYFLIEELIPIQLTKNVYAYGNKKSKKYFVNLFVKKFKNNKYAKNLHIQNRKTHLSLAV